MNLFFAANQLRALSLSLSPFSLLIQIMQKTKTAAASFHSLACQVGLSSSSSTDTFTHLCDSSLHIPSHISTVTNVGIAEKTITSWQVSTV